MVWAVCSRLNSVSIAPTLKLPPVVRVAGESAICVVRGMLTTERPWCRFEAEILVNILRSVRGPLQILVFDRGPGFKATST